MKECCEGVLWRRVLWGSVIEKCCREVLWGSVVKECCGEVS